MSTSRTDHWRDFPPPNAKPVECADCGTPAIRRCRNRDECWNYRQKLRSETIKERKK